MKHRQPKRDDWRMKPARKRIVTGEILFTIFCRSPKISTEPLGDGMYRHAIEYQYIPTIITSTDTRRY